ncbi:hypothetical protein U9M48_028172 [Paspalum notatum var. saurae]|uniref:Uncharacterized protein n=1 Tax=Paspalum notatum var. saurae TaxID=547442 RepID=A0AAQ3TVZ3_PASNO
MVGSAARLYGDMAGLASMEQGNELRTVLGFLREEGQELVRTLADTSAGGESRTRCVGKLIVVANSSHFGLCVDKTVQGLKVIYFGGWDFPTLLLTSVLTMKFYNGDENHENGRTEELEK